MKDILELAKFYVSDMGLSVIPIHRPHDGICSCPKGATCPSPGKHPAMAEWAAYQSRFPTEAELEAWFSDPEKHNIAILGGGPFNCIIMDFDDRDTYYAMRRIAPVIKSTATVETGKGFHAYFLCTDPVRTTKFTTLASPNTHHVKGAGGYCVAPPSVHATGRVYAWTEWPPAPLTIKPGQLQGWLRRIGAAEVKPQDGRLPSGREAGWAADLIRSGARVGERDEETFKLASHLLQSPIPLTTIIAILELWATRCDPPWGTSDIEAKLDSALAMKRRRGQ